MEVLKFFLWFILALVLIAATLTMYQALVIYSSIKGVSYTQVPFNRPFPHAKHKFLFLGDSTAVGTGASDNTRSTSGYFGQDFPDAEIVNISRNGKKLRELLREFDTQSFGYYDLVVMQIGANDILKFTSFKDIEHGIGQAIERAKKIGRHVVVLHSGNVGIAPVFRWPFDCIMTERSRKVRAIYIRQAQNHGALYVDLFSERNNDLFLKDVGRYYSRDLLHPSGDGYRYWYDRIRYTLNQNGISLE